MVRRIRMVLLLMGVIGGGASVAQAAPATSVSVFGLPISTETCRSRIVQALTSEGFGGRLDFGTGHIGFTEVQSASIGCVSRPGETVIMIVVAGDDTQAVAQVLSAKDRLVALMRGAGARGSGCTGFAGHWDTDAGPLTIGVDGSQASGSYVHPSQGSSMITGAVSGNLLDGQWRSVSAGKWGHFRFTLTSGGGGFTGRWTEADGSGGGAWNGQCSRTR